MIENMRPAWAETNDEMRTYYDTEWGLPVRDTQGIFERIVLEGFQAGLSWSTILRKREAFRQAFADFDPHIVAAFSEADVERLASNKEIIRNRQKIRAAIGNARATVEMSERGEDLAALVWSHQPDDPAKYRGMGLTECAESIELSRALKDRGFSFVGPVTMFALMEAIGILHHR